MTAMHAVLCAGGVLGKTVLVSRGAGSVAQYAVQFFRMLGARLVIATISSAEKAVIAHTASAHAFLNHRAEDVAARVWELTGDMGVGRDIEVDNATNATIHAKVTTPGV